MVQINIPDAKHLLIDNDEIDLYVQLDASQFDWLAHGNPYDLSPERRAILVFKCWNRSVDEAWQCFASIKAQYDTILQDTEEISKRRKLAILQKAKIIGMTTTVSRLGSINERSTKWT